MNQIVKNFNNLIKKTIFKVQNKTNDNFKISSFNKYLITFVCSLFLYLFYLLIPTLYDKTWVQTNIESKIINEFKISLNNTSNISYRILPAPHFLIQDSKISTNNTAKLRPVAEIKNFKVFLKQGNFFDKEKIDIKKVIISNANFSLSKQEFKLFKETSNNKLSNKKIKINKSNIFLKNNLNEIITIIKINKAILFFDEKQKINIINLKSEIFNEPFTFNFKSKNNSNLDKMININAKSLKLSIFDESNNKKKIISGKNIITFLNSTMTTNYNINSGQLLFESDNTKIRNPKIYYNGKLSINPFDLNVDINLSNYKISKLLNVNSILTELIKTDLLFNNNISLNSTITAATNAKGEFFQNTKIHIIIIDGKINFDKTKFINDKIGSLELNNSNLFVENDKLILNTDIKINIENSNNLFSFLQTNKKSRKLIKNILINLNYDFLTKEIQFNDVKIDNNEVSDQLLNIIGGFNDNNFNNLNNSRRLLNKILNSYEG